MSIENLILERLESLTEGFGTFNDKLEALNDKVEALDNRIEALDDKVEALDNRIEALDNRIEALDDKVEALDDKVDNLDWKYEKRFNELDERITQTQLMIENDISKKIDIIGEGHDFLKQQLDKALAMEKKRESMELQLINQKMEIDKIKQHLGIA